jgi:hypothetical protein
VAIVVGRSFDEAMLLRIGGVPARTDFPRPGAEIRMTNLVEIRDLNIRASPAAHRHRQRSQPCPWRGRGARPARRVRLR